MINEQWKSGGDCSKCHRQKYCTKACREHVRAISIYINELVDETISEIMTERDV